MMGLVEQSGGKRLRGRLCYAESSGVCGFDPRWDKWLLKLARQV